MKQAPTQTKRPICRYCTKQLVPMNNRAGEALFSCSSRDCLGSRQYFYRNGQKI